MKKIILAMLVLLLLCGCEKGAEIPSGISESTQSMTAAEAVTAASETTFTTAAETTVTTAETSAAAAETTAASPFKNSEFYQYMQEWQGKFFYDASFCDLDLDGHYELLLRGSDDRSFDTDIYKVYKLNDEIPTLYGRIDLESSQSRYIENTICGGKLQRYYDSEKGVYVIIGDATKWDDGSFGYTQYYVIENILYSDKIESKTLNEFSGTRCSPAKYIREETAYSNESFYVYYNGIFDLYGTEKFADISDITEKYKFIDTIDLDVLEKYKDIDKIMELVSEYAGYENTNEVLAPDKKYIGITGVSNHEICTNDTEVYIEIKDIDELDWNKICEIEDLHEFVLHYFGEDEIDIDLSPLKKYYNLTSISIRGNISKNTKRQISEFTNLEYVDMWDILISSEEDFEYVKNLPKLRYIAVSSDNDDPDYFKFLYDNKSIEWIRFDNSVTNEQVKRTIDNMPNIEAVTFGFSEV